MALLAEVRGFCGALCIAWDAVTELVEAALEAAASAPPTKAAGGAAPLGADAPACMPE